MRNYEEERERIRALFEEGDWKTAENEYRQFFSDSLLQAPESIEMEGAGGLITDYAQLLLLKERRQECANAARAAMANLHLHPDAGEKNIADWLRAHCILAESLSLENDFHKAIEILDSGQNALPVETLDASSEIISLTLQSTAIRASLSIALEDFQEARIMIEEALSASHTECEGLAALHGVFAMLCHLEGEFDTAKHHFEISSRILESVDHSVVFQDICFGQATLLVSQSRYPEAIAWLGSRIEERQKIIGRNHPLLKRAISALALAHAAYGQLEEAEIEAQRYNSIVELMGDAGVELKIDCLRTLSDILVDQSRYSEAAVLLSRAKDLLQRSSDKNLAASIVSDLARLKIELGQYEEGERLCEKALKLTLETKGEDHLETAVSWSTLGSAYFANRKTEEAERAYRHAINLLEKDRNFLPSFISAESYRHLAIILTLKGNYDEAEALFIKILAMHSSGEHQVPVQAAETHKNLGELYEAQDRLSEASTQYEQAYTIAIDIFDEDSYELADFAQHLGDLHRIQGRFDEARVVYEKVLSNLEKTLGPAHPKTCAILQRFGELAINEQNYQSARGYFEKALGNIEQTLGADHPDTGYAYYCLGAAHHWQENLAEAENCYRKALSIKEKQLGTVHKDLAALIELLIEILDLQGKTVEQAALHRRLNEINGYDSQKR